jgi:hypothetical protein
MQGARDLKHLVPEGFAKVSEDILHDSQTLDTRYGVLNDNPNAGNLLVSLTLPFGKLPTGWFLEGQNHLGTRKLIALKSKVHDHTAALREFKLRLIKNRLVMLFAFAGPAQVFDPLLSETDDQVILDGVPTLFSAVIQLLLYGVFGPLNRSFDSITDVILF